MIDSFGWKSDPPLTPFAPSYSYHFTNKEIFSKQECKEWNDYLLKQEKILLDKYKTAPMGDGGTGLGNNSITSRFPHYNLLNSDFYLIPELKIALLDGIKNILFISDNKEWKETLYTNCWFNVLRQTEGMKTHTHGCHKNTFYGFHLTINATETSTSYYNPINEAEFFHVPNKIGVLTLFPAIIPHGVNPNKYGTPRISIAGDIYPSTWLNEDALNQSNLVEMGKC